MLWKTFTQIHMNSNFKRASRMKKRGHYFYSSTPSCIGNLLCFSDMKSAWKNNATRDKIKWKDWNQPCWFQNPSSPRRWIRTRIIQDSVLLSHYKGFFFFFNVLSKNWIVKETEKFQKVSWLSLFLVR